MATAPSTTPFPAFPSATTYPPPPCGCYYPPPPCGCYYPPPFPYATCLVGAPAPSPSPGGYCSAPPTFPNSLPASAYTPATVPAYYPTVPIPTYAPIPTHQHQQAVFAAQPYEPHWPPPAPNPPTIQAPPQPTTTSSTSNSYPGRCFQPPPAEPVTTAVPIPLLAESSSPTSPTTAPASRTVHAIHAPAVLTVHAPSLPLQDSKVDTVQRHATDRFTNRLPSSVAKAACAPSSDEDDREQDALQRRATDLLLDQTSFDAIQGQFAKLTAMASQLANSLAKHSTSAHTRTPAASAATAPASVVSQVFGEWPTRSSCNRTDATSSAFAASMLSNAGTTARPSRVGSTPSSFCAAATSSASSASSQVDSASIAFVTPQVLGEMPTPKFGPRKNSSALHYYQERVTPPMSPPTGQNVGVMAPLSVAAQGASLAPVCCPRTNNIAGSEMMFVHNLQVPITVQDYDTGLMDRQASEEVKHESEHILKCFSKAPENEQTNACPSYISEVCDYTLEQQQQKDEKAPINVQLKAPPLNILVIQEKINEWDPGIAISSNMYIWPEMRAANTFNDLQYQLQRSKTVSVWDPGILSLMEMKLGKTAVHLVHSGKTPCKLLIFIAQPVGQNHFWAQLLLCLSWCHTPNAFLQVQHCCLRIVLACSYSVLVCLSCKFSSRTALLSAICMTTDTTLRISKIHQWNSLSAKHFQDSSMEKGCPFSAGHTLLWPPWYTILLPNQILWELSTEQVTQMPWDPGQPIRARTCEHATTCWRMGCMELHYCCIFHNCSTLDSQQCLHREIQLSTPLKLFMQLLCVVTAVQWTEQIHALEFSLMFAMWLHGSITSSELVKPLVYYSNRFSSTAVCKSTAITLCMRLVLCSGKIAQEERDAAAVYHIFKTQSPIDSLLSVYIWLHKHMIHLVPNDSELFNQQGVPGNYSAQHVFLFSQNCLKI